MKRVIIYTDGACRGNPGPGGWGALLRFGSHEKKIFGGEWKTTNNRMEVTAALKALMLLKESCMVEVHTDSQYLQRGISEWLPSWKKRNWKTANRKPIKNADLWIALDALAQKHTIKWYWIKGHSGHKENELVDALANQGIDELQQLEK